MRVMALVAAVACTAPAAATVLQAFTLEELAARSAVVVRGTVGASRAEWRGRVIHTLTDVTVDEVLAGPRPDSVRVVQLGGRVGRDIQPVEGVADLQPGDRVVLFLRAAPAPGEFHLAGMSQGRLRVGPGGILSWQATAPVWDGTALRVSPARTLTLDALRPLLRGRP
ncbi:MAG: hypothetical protein HY904_23955 [Deltaproteobacteria bacterium]|nr:hypothetical protein [Deltaproteobacteria bacterium]